jgi:hypothetical protein
MAVAFSEPIDGVALVFRADDAAVPARFAEHDPYVHNGLVTQWKVRRLEPRSRRLMRKRSSRHAPNEAGRTNDVPAWRRTAHAG